MVTKFSVLVFLCTVAKPSCALVAPVRHSRRPLTPRSASQKSPFDEIMDALDTM